MKTPLLKNQQTMDTTGASTGKNFLAIGELLILTSNWLDCSYFLWCDLVGKFSEEKGNIQKKKKKKKEDYE